jgi:CRISPR-associated protein Csb2
MAHFVDFTIRFFSDRYHGAVWPPSPARLFQALVAGAKSGAPASQWSVRHEDALRWLECQKPPEIFARPDEIAEGYTLFVPNNSLSGESSTKTSKSVNPRLLADHSIGQPDVIYRWQVEDVSIAQNHLPILDQLASRLRALGWGVDFAAAIASFSENALPYTGLEQFTPAARGGISLPVPISGFLEHLAQSHLAFIHRITTAGVNPNTRPTLFGQARYQKTAAWRPRRWIAFEMETISGDPLAVRWDQVQVVAAWVRHAAGEALKQEDLDQAWIDSFVLGHTSSTNPGNRLSFVPLASIGHQHSDGGVRRVIIAEPPDCGADAEALNLLRLKLVGSVLTDSGGTERAILSPILDASKVLPRYMDSAKVWQTVTPVILHGYNSARGRISLVKTDRLLCQAFSSAGFPEAIIDNITFQSAPYWSGTGASTAIRVPRHLAEWPRVHVKVEFKQAIQGPVLAGIGRHYGIGIFAAHQGG